MNGGLNEYKLDYEEYRPLPKLDSRLKRMGDIRTRIFATKNVRKVINLFKRRLK